VRQRLRSRTSSQAALTGPIAFAKTYRIASWAIFLLTAMWPTVTMAQPATPSGAKQAKLEGGDSSAPAEAQADKRAFGVLPNYRTVEANEKVDPLTARRKFQIAAKDSFDYPVYFVTAGFAGISQIENSNPSYGQGMQGYALRYAAAYGDQLIGNIMTEGLFPSLLHEDMRYYRRGAGGAGVRAFYALTRILVTRTDAGRTRFNFSEVATPRRWRFPTLTIRTCEIFRRILKNWASSLALTPSPTY